MNGKKNLTHIITIRSIKIVKKYKKKKKGSPQPPCNQNHVAELTPKSIQNKNIKTDNNLYIERESFTQMTTIRATE